MDAPDSESPPTERWQPSWHTPRKLWIVAASALIIAIAIGIAYLSFVADGGNRLTESELAVMLQPLANADKLTLYSFDGNEFLFASQKPSEEGEFYGCPVLGKIEITEQDKIKAVFAAVEAGIQRGGRAAACFWPHHAIRAERDGQTVDFVICFHCSNFRIYSNETLSDGGQTTNAAEKLLNRYLTEAGIPIATK